MNDTGIVDSLLIMLGFGGNVPEESKKIEKSLDGIAETASGVITAINAIGAAFVGLAFDAVEAGDDAATTAEQLNTTTEALTALRYAADMSDVSVGALQTGLKIFNRTLGQAGLGSKSAQAAFRTLGLDFRELAKLPTDKAFGKLAGALEKVQNPAEKFALASKILGRGAAELIPLLNRGEDGIAAFTEEAAKIGIVIGTDAATAAGELDDSMKRLNARFEGAKLKIGMGLIPVIERIVDKMTTFYDNNKEIIDQRIDLTIDIISSAFEALSGPLGIVWGILSGWAGSTVLLNIINGMTGLSLSLASVGAALGWTAALIALGLALQDFYTYMTGGESVVGELIKSLGLEEGLGAAFHGLIDLGSAVIAIFREMGSWAAIILSPLTKLAEIIGSIAIGLGYVVGSKAFEALNSVLGVGGAIGSAVGSAAGSVTSALQTTRESLFPVSNTMTSVGGASSSTTNNVNNAQVTVHVTGASDPAATGRAVRDEIAKQNRDALSAMGRGGR